MGKQMEISNLDLRFEGYRLKNKAAERILLASILENGIRDPLQCVDTKDAQILLNGFKRYRCAKKLNIRIVPYCSLAEDAGVGIIEFLRMSNAKNLSILEQARLIDELKNVHQMSTKEIAQCLEKSKAWVSVRSGIIKDISPAVMDRIFNGQFPVYAYMYVLRPFIRINKIKTEEIDEFVNLVAGNQLSIRDIDMLAKGYFKGTPEFREQIRSGKLEWGLEQLKETTPGDTGNCSEQEKRTLKSLEIILRYMQRFNACRHDTMSNTFAVQANILSGHIIRQLDIFPKILGAFYDRTGQTDSGLPASQRGHGHKKDCPRSKNQHQYSEGNHQSGGPNTGNRPEGQTPD